MQNGRHAHQHMCKACKDDNFPLKLPGLGAQPPSKVTGFVVGGGALALAWRFWLWLLDASSLSFSGEGAPTLSVLGATST